MDEMIGDFFNKINVNDKIIIITSDHGEEFGEQGEFGHRPDKLIHELTHVPMIKINGIEKGVIREKSTHRNLLEMILNEVQ